MTYKRKSKPSRSTDDLEFRELLCELVEEEPSIWNKRSDEYHVKERRTRAWNRIKERMLEQGHVCEVSYLKNTWKRQRDMFFRNKPSSGSAARTYHGIFRCLAFLDTAEVEGSRMSNIPSEDSEEDNEEVENDENEPLDSDGNKSEAETSDRHIQEDMPSPNTRRSPLKPLSSKKSLSADVDTREESIELVTWSPIKAPSTIKGSALEILPPKKRSSDTPAQQSSKRTSSQGPDSHDFLGKRSSGASDKRKIVKKAKVDEERELVREAAESVKTQLANLKKSDEYTHFGGMVAEMLRKMNPQQALQKMNFIMGGLTGPEPVLRRDDEVPVEYEYEAPMHVDPYANPLYASLPHYESSANYQELQPKNP